MATNLVSLVTEFLTPDMVERIASALSLDSNKVQSAVSATVPVLLAAFSDTAMQPDGAQKLADAAVQQASVLESFSSALAAGEQSSLFDSGSQMLGSLVSGQNQNAITVTISEFTGLEEGASGSVLGILAPVVMGTIARHQGKARLNANDIANFLASQKDNIIAALPSGFGRLLRETELLNSFNREQERLTEDEMATVKLGPRGVPNEPGTATMTRQSEKNVPKRGAFDGSTA
jgi:Bacterial protein of unknown function (DUF937)